MKEYTLDELYAKLEDGSLTSEGLVKAYLERIYTYDPNLRSIGEINPLVLVEARLADAERKKSGARSRLHGIPIVLKDNINTHDHMHTSAGSKALEDVYAPYDATVTQKLRDAGMVLLGKANLSEFAYFMSTEMPCGFSSRFGQVVSPYDSRIDPLGSSTGSAVAVAANLIPVSIGTETNGSLMSPAMANCICSIKPTLGMVSRYGILPITGRQDTAGPMARTVQDCARLMDVLYGKDPHDPDTLLNPKAHYDFTAACSMPLSGKRLGLLTLAEEEGDAEIDGILQEARTVFTALGVTCVSVSLPTREVDNMVTLLHEFKGDLNQYLSTLGEATPRKTLHDIIAYNQLDPQTRMPYNQQLLEMSDALSGHLTEPEYYEAKVKQLQEAGQLLCCMEEHQLDAIAVVNPIGHGAILGSPTLCVPANTAEQLRPMNLVFAARHWDDEVLFAFGTAYENATHHRVPPVLQPAAPKAEA